ncbi:helix-turn-helix domain-containing protein [Actinomadura formosensis]|uniref:helix-turn-helix domain-containing protein n=1 Tax=Actinomadura formosensis TaxID=60706 RepID=UPI000830A879|nr:helix-turn-helix transcriptional regulator [Actinomadura formosensis]
MRELGGGDGEWDEESASEAVCEPGEAVEESLMEDTPERAAEPGDDPNLVPLHLIEEAGGGDEGDGSESWDGTRSRWTLKDMPNPESALLSLKRDFGRLFDELIKDALTSPGVTMKAIADEANWSPDTLSRLLRGERLPSSMKEFQDWITALERLTRRPVDPEKLAEAREKVTEAGKLPQTLKDKYEALLATHGQLWERKQSNDRTISDLNAMISLLHEQNRAAGIVPVWTADGQSFAAELARRQRDLRTRRARLLQTQATLRKALQQQQLDLEELARCAQELLDVTDTTLKYLDAVLDPGPDGQDQN